MVCRSPAVSKPSLVLCALAHLAAPPAAGARVELTPQTLKASGQALHTLTRDVDGDGVNDIITGTGPGIAAQDDLTSVTTFINGSPASPSANAPFSLTFAGALFFGSVMNRASRKPLS